MTLEDFSKKYFDLLTIEYKTINLTRINTYADFYNKQILDSIAPLRSSEIFKDQINKAKNVLDIGFGGGFPILPLASELKTIKFIGIEARAKKANVVSEISKKLSLTNTSFYHLRLEDMLIDKKVMCTFKAVGKINDYLSKINNSVETTVFFYKGPSLLDEEADQLVDAEKEWELIEQKEIYVPGTDKRYIIGFKSKLSKIRTAKDPSKLVNLSSLN